MKVAFYAPLKSPDSPVPSGDRLIGRMLRRAIESGGHEVELVSRLRTFDRDGDPDRQRRLAVIGAKEQTRALRRLLQPGRRPDLWLTYHLYHKAPDWIGPGVARALAIPYCVAEASSSPRQANGAWAEGHRAVAAALAEARLVIGINPKDQPGISPLVGPHTRMAAIAPFIDGALFRSSRAQRVANRASMAATFELDPDRPWLLAVGMLRLGDKARSYALLARALSLIGDRPWQLIVVGDGGARIEIEVLFAGMADRVRFVGQQTGAAIARLMAAADIFVWPAINEAIGMVFIEAAMAGLPVVGARRPGIAAIVDDGRTGLLVAEHDAAAFAAATARLLDDAPVRLAMGAAAGIRAAAQNDLSTAGMLLVRELEAVVR